MLALGFLRASSELKTCVTYSKYMADGLAQRNIFRIEIFYVPFGSVYSMYFYLFFGRGIETYQNSKYSRIVIYIYIDTHLHQCIGGKRKTSKPNHPTTALRPHIKRTKQSSVHQQKERGGSSLHVTSLTSLWRL